MQSPDRNGHVWRGRYMTLCIACRALSRDSCPGEALEHPHHHQEETGHCGLLLIPFKMRTMFLHWQLWCLTSGPENDPLFMGWLSWMEAEYLNGLTEYSVSGVLSSGGLLVSFSGLWIPVRLAEDPFFALWAG